MANIDLSGYTLGALKDLQREIETQIKDRQQQDLQKAREQILEIAQKAGLPVDELIAANIKKSKKGTGQKVQARFRNPANNAQTWTGRGRQPRWIADGLAAGKSLDDFRI